jgi:hypothetical protein
LTRIMVKITEAISELSHRRGHLRPRIYSLFGRFKTRCTACGRVGVWV